MLQPFVQVEPTQSGPPDAVYTSSLPEGSSTGIQGPSSYMASSTDIHSMVSSTDIHSMASSTDIHSMASVIPITGHATCGMQWNSMEFVETHPSLHGYCGERRSSSEEKTGQIEWQSRRRAQNREAQRAFRERKANHLKNLQAELLVLESSKSELESENQKLKIALERAMAVNEMLQIYSRPDWKYAPSYQVLTPQTSRQRDSHLAIWDLEQSEFVTESSDIDVSKQLQCALQRTTSDPVFTQRDRCWITKVNERVEQEELA